MSKKQQISPEEYDPKLHVKEFKRKCNHCRKVWHVLESREKEIKSAVSSSNCDVMSTCGNPNAQYQAKRNVDAGKTELDKLQKCPECQSADYSEQTMIYNKKT